LLAEPSGAFVQVIVFNVLRKIDMALDPLGLHQAI